VEEKLNEIFNELQKEAYNLEYHNYDYKLTNQIIRKHFENLVAQIEPLIMPKTCGQCKDCKYFKSTNDALTIGEHFECTNYSENSALGDLATYPNFGCILFESRLSV
jgi:hypothetical protein